jgi:hypothetical protein
VVLHPVGIGFALLQGPLPKLNYDMIPDFFQLPPGEHLVEPAGVAVNSKGHIYVFHRGKHPLMEFDSSGKFVHSIAAHPILELSLPGARLASSKNAYVQLLAVRVE